MGQTSQIKGIHSPTQLIPTTNYEQDPRMINFTKPMNTSLSAAAEILIDEIQDIYQKIPRHPLEKYLLHGIIRRFSLLSSHRKDKKEVTNVRQENQDLEWTELKGEEEFFKLMDVLKLQYESQLQVMRYFLKDKGALDLSSGIRVEFLRKASQKLNQDNPDADINQTLILRLYFSFYLSLLRNNSNSKQLLIYHNKTGRQLSHMIFANEIPLSELFTILFRIVQVDRYGLNRSGNLDLLNRDYHAICMRQSYTLNIDSRRCQMLKAAARLYLDELYLLAVRQAEDPNIKSEDDCLHPTKTFPIYRVKSKLKNQMA